jgi:hypothetical protein
MEGEAIRLKPPGTFRLRLKAAVSRITRVCPTIIPIWQGIAFPELAKHLLKIVQGGP